MVAVVASLGGAAILVTAVIIVSMGAGAATAPSMPGRVATRTTIPLGGDPTRDQTVRDIMYTSVAGNEVRVRLSNSFGHEPVEVGAASLGVVLNGSQLVPGRSQSVTFDGHTSVTIPAGKQLLSDPIQMRVPRSTALAIDLYLPRPTGPATHHKLAWQTSYVASGDHVGDAASTAFMKTGSWYLVDGVDVGNSVTPTPGTVVAFGDSITAEVGNNVRWPNYLSRRLNAALGKRAPAVVNAGISGNRVLNDSTCYGQSALARFRRDALSQAGVKAVILLEGINDIGFSGEQDTGCFAPNNPTVTAAAIEAGYRRLIKMAHASGVKIFAGTLTPFLGSHCIYGGNFGTRKGEVLRERVNHWIRTSHAFDGEVDFDRATASPHNPRRLRASYNSTGDSACQSGDGLHPNDLGEEAMADAIPLRWFTR
jgi:lysophospholipase L1-like esterase